jgi:hypothetical protein
MDRVEFSDLPPEPERLVWCEWLRRHGVDPRRVLATGGFIERREDTCQLAYAAIERVRVATPPVVRFTHEGEPWDVVESIQVEDKLAKVEVVFQLEAPPLPWPQMPPPDDPDD